MIVLGCVTALLCVLVGVLTYLVYLNYKRAERATSYCEIYVRFVAALYFKVRDTRDSMKQIDRLGAFAADDEVGVAFKEIEGCVDSLHTFLTKYVNSDESTKENEKA